MVEQSLDHSHLPKAHDLPFAFAWSGKIDHNPRMDNGDKIDFEGETYVITDKKEGGFGTVFKAEPEGISLSPNLAVKTLLPAYAKDGEWRKRFEREARILANIDHPNVVKIKSTLPLPDGTIAIVQEYVHDARSMDEYFKAATEPQKLSICLQVLYGLRATHGGTPKFGAIHRDVSPYNILIDKSGTAKIIDFGLARANPRGSAVMTIGYSFGTPGCTAPEQRKDAATADHRADLFGLGRSLAASIQERHPEHADCAALPEPWRSICIWLSQHEPINRPGDCDEAIAHILEQFVAVGIVPDHPTIHFAEFAERWPTFPMVWPVVLQKMITSLVDPFERFYLSRLIVPKVLEDFMFDADGLFEYLDEEVFESIFGQTTAAFSTTDLLGNLIIAWYPYLNNRSKLIAFKRLVSTAVNYNRYQLMHQTRWFYFTERSGSIAEELLQILDEADPAKIIEGRGMIPERTL